MLRALTLIALACLAFAWTSARAGPAPASALAIVGARAYPAPDAAPIEDAVVVARGGRITAVGPRATTPVPRGARVIDAHGAVLTAGFWNSHVHLMQPDMLDAAHQPAGRLDDVFGRMLTRWGFTTVFDISSQLANTQTLRRRIAAGEVAGPQILTTGDGFFPEGGTPVYIKDFMRQHAFPTWEVKTPAEAAARAARQLDAGADAVKIFSGAYMGRDGVIPMPLPIAKAVVDEAHKRGKPAFAHPQNLTGIDVAIEAGVDVLAHTTPDQPWPPQTVRRIADHHMALIPTLTLFDVEVSKDPTATPAVVAHILDTVVGETRAYAEAGGQILFGTDVGYTDAFDTTEEFRLMARAMSWRQVLAALTTAPAQRFGQAARKGRIAPGLDADLVLLSADPAQDPTAFAKVRDTIRGGRVIWEAER
jgi:imidazolonepropionase-like amidohydrolase